MIDDAIYDAFALRLAAFAALSTPALPVAYPDVAFTPPSTGKWLEAQWIPNRSRNYGMEDDGPTMMQGLAQVNVCFRPGGGLMAGLALANQVVQYFNKGTRFDIARVYVKPWVANVLPETTRVAYPVTISWRAMVDG